jgi:hypothetical protein
MNLSNTADPSEIKVHTDPFAVSVGTQPSGGVVTAASPGPRPDLNGVRCKFSNRPHIYMIDRGYRRHIPNPETYNNLFRDWSGVVVDNDIDEIPEGRAIESGAVLSRGHSTPHVYLVEHGQKRHVTSPSAMDKYHFAWGRVYIVPQVQIDAIPTGPAIS